jgi:hypothetical protein
MNRTLPLVCATGYFVTALGAFVMIGLVTPIATAYRTTLEAAGFVVDQRPAFDRLHKDAPARRFDLTSAAIG